MGRYPMREDETWVRDQARRIREARERRAADAEAEDRQRDQEPPPGRLRRAVVEGPSAAPLADAAPPLCCECGSKIREETSRRGVRRSLCEACYAVAEFFGRRARSADAFPQDLGAGNGTAVQRQRDRLAALEAEDAARFGAREEDGSE